MEAGTEYPAVGSRKNADIQDTQHAPVRTGPNESAQALLEREHGHGDLERIERVAALLAYALGACSYDRIVGGSKGESIHGHARESFTLHVNPFPEG